MFTVTNSDLKTNNSNKKREGKKHTFVYRNKHQILSDILCIISNSFQFWNGNKKYFKLEM